MILDDDVQERDWEGEAREMRARQKQVKEEEAKRQRDKMTDKTKVQPKTKKCYTAETLKKEKGDYPDRCVRCMTEAAKPGKASRMTRLVCYSGKHSRIEQLNIQRARRKKKTEEEEQRRIQREEAQIQMGKKRGE